MCVDTDWFESHIINISIFCNISRYIIYIQWIQFSSLNRARREHPSNWVHCSTCQSVMDFSFLHTGHITPTSFVLSSLLNNKSVLRLLLLSAGALVLLPFSPQLVLGFLTSTSLWQQVSNVTYILHNHAVVVLSSYLHRNLFSCSISSVPKLVILVQFPSICETLGISRMCAVYPQVLHLF